MHGAATCILLLGICILCLTDQSDACKDRKRNCKELAEKGFCTQNKKAKKMKKMCRASCNLCSADTGKAPETTGGAGCTDMKRSCKKKAAKGFCTHKKHSKKMKNRCKASCHLCDTQCEDEKRNCKKQAGKGFCTDKKHAKKMRKHCKKSCNLCSGTSGTPQVPGDTQCEDEKWNCKKQAGKGFCTDKKHAKKMRKHCKKSCNLCSGTSGTAGTDTPQVPGDTQCEDEKRNCKKQAGKGFCTDKKHAKKMRKHCKKSCNLCSGTSGTPQVPGIQNMPGRPSSSGPEEP